MDETYNMDTSQSGGPLDDYLHDQANGEIERLRRENERLRALLREIASFMEADPPDLRPRRREWQAERDALVERAREAL